MLTRKEKRLLKESTAACKMAALCYDNNPELSAELMGEANRAANTIRAQVRGEPTAIQSHQNHLEERTRLQQPYASKNHSMLEEASMSEQKAIFAKMRKQLGLYNPAMNAPLGHVYTTIVEELGIEDPCIDNFIEELLLEFENIGERTSMVKDPKESISFSSLCYPLTNWLRKREEFKTISDKAFKKIEAQAKGHY
ncbi:hypothetical protein GOV04_02785 [Candidatus Woesearchaeota archaeon]|nr:hypothetical protein [Candidatus Woesearchaeota archaeon]